MTRKLLHLTMIASICPFLFACGGSDDPPAQAEPPLPPKEQLIEDFWGAMDADDFSVHADLYERATTLVEAQPDDGRLDGFRAAVGIWTISEAQRDPDFDPAKGPAMALQSQADFDKASKLDAGDPHWIGFVAGTKFLIAKGNDSAMAEAIPVYDASYEAYPAFGPIAKVFTMAGIDAGHELLPEAEQAVWDHFERCFGALDHASPDLGQLGLEDPPGLCKSAPYVPHLYEGMAIFGGDILLKSGKVTAAQRLFQSAQKSSTYDGWVGKADLEARLSSLEERAGLYADGDPANDPEVGVAGHACTGCHAR